VSITSSEDRAAKPSELSFPTQYFVRPGKQAGSYLFWLPRVDTLVQLAAWTADMEFAAQPRQGLVDWFKSTYPQVNSESVAEQTINR
jgi:hypothetical protein